MNRPLVYLIGIPAIALGLAIRAVLWLMDALHLPEDER